LETYRFIEQKFLPALPHIKARVLLMQSGRDEYIRRDSAMVIGKKYGRPLQVLVIPRGHHRPFRDPAATRWIGEHVTQFITSGVAQAE
ncbi:MAG: hypothetical protein HY092_02340, partial [Candidatus Kerfeldbacteria bacterium]|nr:hypothetical protein [Candidatus Kerfeldbacteria bacterium]